MKKIFLASLCTLTLGAVALMQNPTVHAQSTSEAVVAKDVQNRINEELQKFSNQFFEGTLTFEDYTRYYNELTGCQTMGDIDHFLDKIQNVDAGVLKETKDEAIRFLQKLVSERKIDTKEFNRLKNFVLQANSYEDVQRVIDECQDVYNQQSLEDVRKEMLAFNKKAYEEKRISFNEFLANHFTMQYQETISELQSYFFNNLAER